MRLRNQRGCLRCTRRKTGPLCWEFLWRENDADGNRTRRTAVIGTLEQFPTRELAQAAVNGLRMSINQDRNRQREQSIAVAELVDHYIVTELSDEADWHSHATRIVYSEFLKRWIRPHWGGVGIRDVRTVAVERWLKQLRRVNGERLADATKAKIRNLMSVLFNHAIGYEWLEQGRNPITLVRQSAKRKCTPEILEPHEIQNLLKQLTSCFRLMVLLDVTTGLRRSGLLALKWSDVDFSTLELNVVRSIYLRNVGNCKTEASRKPVPLDAHVAADLWLLQELFALNRRLMKAYLLKESLDRLWSYRYPGAMMRYLKQWMNQLRWQRLQPMEKLADTLVKHLPGILNYCTHKVPLGVVEAINGNIKALLRRGRGYRDINYLLLKAQRLAFTKTEFIAFQKAA
jgi:integrase